MAKEAHLAMQKTMEDALAELCKQRDDLLHQLAEVRACKFATYIVFPPRWISLALCTELGLISYIRIAPDTKGLLSPAK